MTAGDRDFDVVILGGGLASLCLARLLQLEVPQARVVTLDTGQGPRRKVGESTVEIGSHFLHTRLRLADVLARTQLPKNGLRYWFDDAERSLPFGEASEDGPATFSYWRSYQLERTTLEQSLLELESATHLFGLSELQVLARGRDGEHRVAFQSEGRRCELSARWLIDARGAGAFSDPPSPNLELEERVSHSACWMWFEGAQPLDELVPPSAARPCVAPRRLSTNHFLYEGYWIWAIPLASGLLSVGLVYDHTVLRDAPADAEAMEAFLRSHRMVEQLLEGACPVEFGRLRNYTRRPKQVVTDERTGYVGLAAGFVDPFYSNGIDMIALACEAIGEAIERDLAGTPLGPEAIAAYNHCVLQFYEQVVMFVGGIYPSFASYELSLIRYRRDLHVYWTLFTWAYLSGQLFQLEFLARFTPVVEASLERGRFFARLLQHTQAELKSRGELRRANRGRYSFNQLGFRNFPYIRCERQMGDPLELDACWRAVDEIDTGSFLALMDCLFQGDRSPLRGLLVSALLPRYDRLLELERAHGFDAAFWEGAFALLSEGINELLAARGLPHALQLDADSFGRVFQVLAASCDEAQEAALRELYYAVPALQDFAPPRQGRDAVQPLEEWSAEHTPWLDRPPAFQTVYDLLGEAWIRGEGGTLRLPLPL